MCVCVCVCVCVYTGVHYAFAAETFGEFLIATQIVFAAYVMLRQSDAVPDRKSITLQVEDFRNNVHRLE